MAEPTDLHHRIVARAFAEGRVVPLLGAGVNLCGRPSGAGWQQGKYLPSGAEMALYLAGSFEDSTHAGIGGPNIAPLDSSPVAQCVARGPERRIATPVEP